MEIQHEEHGKKGSFFMDEGGKRLAELAYLTSAPGKITIYHTEVDESLRGKGVGKQLVANAVDFARDKKLRVEPTCPYASKIIQATADFQDVLI